MRFAEIIEDRDIGNLPDRSPDIRPHVGDSRVWTGAGGIIAKQAKRLKHINDDLDDVDFNNIVAKSEEDDDKLSEPLRQLGDELAKLNQITGHRYNASA
tara:strand:+ start:16 stop:312 length:297 start_codon:yes stop_codon:yes gene_type:complete